VLMSRKRFTRSGSFNAPISATETAEWGMEFRVIRNAFAHGRLQTDNEFPARLWKFGLARDGRVPVEFCEELTVEWFKEKCQRQRVVDCFKARGIKGYGTAARFTGLRRLKTVLTMLIIRTVRHSARENC
jgi:hypothetical protein